MLNIDEIIRLYGTLIGVDVTADLDTIKDWELSKRLTSLRRAQELEPSNALFLMLLEEQLDGFLAKSSVSAATYLDDPAPFDRLIAQAKRLRTLLAASGMPEERERLRESMMDALRQYGAAEREDAQQLVANKYAIAHLWRDALEAMDQTLEVHQFLQGEPEPAGTKPRYVNQVLGFWSINDALRLAASMPSGIAVCMIRDRDAIHSYFAFVIRNGGTLTVVTDRTPYAHPLARAMSRRPDRTLDRRMARAWFPYELLDIQYLTDEDGDVVGLNVPRKEGIIPLQQRAFRLKALSDIGATEVVWTAFMFAYLTKRYVRENWKAPALSYTGEMVELPNLIEAQAHSAGVPVPVGAYAPLQAAEIRSIELTAERVIKEGGVKKVVGNNAWMEARYGHRVDDAMLNRIQGPSSTRTVLLPDGSTAERPAPTSRFHSSDEPRHAGKLAALDATHFGSGETILADRVWIARHNQALAIGVLVQQEFDSRRAEIEAWWTETMEGRREALLAAVYAGSLKVPSEMLTARTEGFQNRRRGEAEILKVETVAEMEKDRLYTHSDMVRFGAPVKREDVRGREYETGKYRCAVTGRPSTHTAVFIPDTADDLAAMAGLPTTEMPDVLRHWQREAPYTGNPILQRLDPMDWAINNPWSKLKFRTRFFLSSFAFPDHSPFSRKKTVA